MKSISDPFLRRPVLTLVLSLLVLLAGLVSLPGLKVENLPQIAPIQVSVRANYPGASPEVVEQGVTTLLEKQLNGLERLDAIRSTSSAGGSSISLSFEGGNPELNQINTQNETAVVGRQLPAQVARFGVQVRRTSSDLLMILSFNADKERYDQVFLGGWVDQVVRDRLQRVPGVGEVRLFGGGSLAFRLWLDPVQLEKRGITITEVRDALEEQNVLAALGQAGQAPSPADQVVTLPLRMEGEGRLRSAGGVRGSGGGPHRQRRGDSAQGRGPGDPGHRELRLHRHQPGGQGHHRHRHLPAGWQQRPGGEPGHRSRPRRTGPPLPARGWTCS